MTTTMIPIPGALRLRSLHPLIEGDGSCSLIYDLERAAVLEVPDELRFHVAPALETGDLDEGLLSWLVNEDLLTCERWGGTAGRVDPFRSGAERASLWNLGPICRLDSGIHSRIDQLTEAAVVEALDLAFRQSLGTRVTLHLDWGGSFPGFPLLERILDEAKRRTDASGVEVCYELTLAARGVTPAIARFLRDYPFHVRVLCGEFPFAACGESFAPLREDNGWLETENGMRLLRDQLAERLTVHCLLTPGVRLRDVWDWAREMRLRRLDAAKVGAPALAELREFRKDLAAICEEIRAGVEVGRIALDFQPLTRVVRRLARSEPPTELYGRRGAYDGGWLGEGSGRPAEDGGRRLWADFWCDTEENALEEAEVEGSACHACWARYACEHSTLSPAAPEGAARLTPSLEHCAFWRAEVEMAVRLYHRLVHADPMRVLRLVEDGFRTPSEPFSMVPGWSSKSVS